MLYEILKRKKKKDINKETSKDSNKDVNKDTKKDAQNNNKFDEKLNTENLKKVLGNSNDLVYRDIVINEKLNAKASLIYVDGIVNQSDISNYIIKPFMSDEKIKNAGSIKEIFKYIEDGVIYYASQSKKEDINDVIREILSGSLAIVFDKDEVAYVFDVKKFDKRSITEPTVENITKGSKDVFVENFRTNTATIRRKLRTPDLNIEQVTLGEQSRTTVGIVYISTIVNDNILNEVRQRLNNINTDSVITTSVIEEALADNRLSIFPQVYATEKPDVFCGDILSGRVGVIVDNIPFTFLLPATFAQYMQASDDYSRKSIVASFLRIVRYVSLILALFLPAFYVAVTSFHPEMLPSSLALFIIKARSGVTFSVPIETILLLLAFEILYEGGIRVPKTVGQAVSIVGTLVVGQAAVEARLISSPVIVVIGITSIASFTIPNQDLSNAVRIIRLLITVFTGVFGLIGMAISLIYLIFHLCKLESFGVAYLSPFVSGSLKEIIPDTIIRIPIKDNKERPANLNTKNKMREGE